LALVDILRRTHSSDDFTDALRTFLNSGTLESGYRLPSVRKLRDLSGLRLHHVNRALETLVAEGRIVQRRGSGTFVADAQERGKKNALESLRIGVIPPLWDPGFAEHAISFYLSGITEQSGLRHRVHVAPAGIAELHPTEFVNHMRSWGLDGVIWLKPPVFPPLALVRLLEAGMPVVLVGRAYPDLPTKAVLLDHKAVGEALVQYIVNKGRRKLLCMVGVRSDHYTRDHVESIRAAMEKRGMALPDDQVVTVRLENVVKTYSMDLRRNVLDFFSQHPDFDAVFSMYPDQLGALAHLHETNVRRCPEDFIHIHYGQLNVWKGQVWPPFLSAFSSSPSTESGRQAVKELERMLGVEGDLTDEDLAPRIDHDPYV